MKKLIIIPIILLIIIGYNIIQNKNSNDDNNNQIIKDNLKPSLEIEEDKYKDNNPIQIGLYKYYGSYKNRELITEFTNNWNYYHDISSFEVFYIKEETITGKNFQDTFKEYYDRYENINNYKIGYNISFITEEKEINKTILSPKDTEEFFNYLEIYLYDDYHREKGVWYSHTTEEEMNENTLLTSIKLTTGKEINKIISDITLTAFTYDFDDFDEYGNYKGISKYTIIVKNPNI